MKCKKVITFVFAGFCVIFSHHIAYTQPKVDWSKQENKAAELVLKLPEIIKADKQCRKLSKGKRHLITYVPDDPAPGNNYFQVNVAEDNGTAYHNWFVFEVEQKTYKIYYVDVVTGDYITLSKWRKNRKAYI